jgi:hypothetical protein
MADRIIVCIGTKKGLFVAESNAKRQSFEVRGPFFPGVAVYSALLDTHSDRIFASSCSPFFGMKVIVSSDLGRTFEATASSPKFAENDGRALANIWSMESGESPGEIWCGVEPASLFHSSDYGNSWTIIDGISNHAHARQWHPGAGGLCAHTIVRHNKRIHLGISTGGHYVSQDNGQTFSPSNEGVGAGFFPDPYPEFGQCVHKIAMHPSNPNRMYMQNHGGWDERPGIGVLRSDDAGRTWTSIAQGLPSDFGFPIVVHPEKPESIYVVPHEPMTRTCPQGATAVFRSENGGDQWQRLSHGLPQSDAYFTVQRDAMTIDSVASPALYLGTTTGQLWIGRDGGEKWDCLFSSLPPIHCVKVAAYGS